MADATSLLALKKLWKISEKPLSRSFRCNNAIAESVRHISGNSDFEGCGEPRNEHCQSYIVRGTDSTYSKCISAFEALIASAGISLSGSAILCRGHKELESISGVANYAALKGLTNEMALAAFHRDVRKDYKKAFHILDHAIREMVDESDYWDALDEEPEGDASTRFKLALWKFIKSNNGLPSVTENSSVWLDQLKANLIHFLQELGITNIPKVGQKIRRTGLDRHQLTLPLFQPQTLFPPIRQETIHQVKGESIDAVLLLGSAKFFSSVIKAITDGKSTEERRLAFVAMTRARHVLVVGLPSSHFDTFSKTWSSWGFCRI